jgi:hypothetical protein
MISKNLSPQRKTEVIVSIATEVIPTKKPRKNLLKENGVEAFICKFFLRRREAVYVSPFSVKPPEHAAGHPPLHWLQRRGHQNLRCTKEAWHQPIWSIHRDRDGI